MTTDETVSQAFRVAFESHPARQSDPALALDSARDAASALVPTGVTGTFDDEALTFTVDTNQISADATSETITREQIVALRQEASAAGDYAQADICGQALAGDEDSIRVCERVIAAADQSTSDEILEEVAAILLPDAAPRARVGLMDPEDREEVLSALRANPAATAREIADEIIAANTANQE